jgi:hypothetical protein
MKLRVIDVFSLHPMNLPQRIFDLMLLAVHLFHLLLV